MNTKAYAIAWFTENGRQTADRIKAVTAAAFVSYDKQTEAIRDWIAKQFNSAAVIIIVGAMGIAVRLIAQHIVSKDTDPAVIVVDENASFIIPILSGHIGGANRVAAELSKKLGAIPVITTATDINNKFAVDAWSIKNNCIIADISQVKYVSSAILSGKTVSFKSDFAVPSSLPDEICISDSGDIGIYVTLSDIKKPFEHTVTVIPKIIVIGTGCKKNISSRQYEDAILGRLSQLEISIRAVKAITSIDIKSEEKCIVDFSRKYKIPFITYTREQLRSIICDSSFTFSSSIFVQNTVGVDNVCERSAVLASNGRLIEKKTSHNGITLAIAMSDWRCSF